MFFMLQLPFYLSTRIGRQHLKNPWSILEIFVTMLSLSAVVLYFLRLKFTNEALKELRVGTRAFVSYHYCAFLDEWFNCILGIIVFLSFLKVNGTRAHHPLDQWSGITAALGIVGS